MKARILVEALTPELARRMTPQLVAHLKDSLGVAYDPQTREFHDMAKTHYLKDGQWIKRDRPQP